MLTGIDSLMVKVREYLPDNVNLVERAYEFAAHAHQGQMRKSGRIYLEHPLHAAMSLVDMRLDADTIAAALLHDVPEDCRIPLEEIEANFNPQVAKLVDGVTKLNKLTDRAETEEIKSNLQAENLRKMLVATTEDLRVLLIKLADRLDNMRSLGALPPDRRRSIAKETLEIYAPLAHRLGMRKMKWQLEDLAFRYLEPAEYHRVAKLVASKRAERESFINEVSQVLCQELQKVNIKAKILGRPKHIYSIYNKMTRYAAQGRNFSDIHDLFALRLLTNSVSDCYKALGVIHSVWRPLSEEFDDLIANPKDNDYRALHTTVMYDTKTPLELQIRTYEMHQVAEYGVAAHWRYKEGKTDAHFDKELAWMRQLIDWKEEMDTEEFLESVKSDVLSDRVFAYTPKGEIKDLPKGATPLDFAFRVHTDMGYRCIGAKVNGKLEPLNYVLKNGDVVDIMVGKQDRGPSLDWLNPVLGYVKSSHARNKIRQWFKKQERGQCIAAGKQIWDKELKRLGIHSTNVDKAMSLFGYSDPDDFFAALGWGNLSISQVTFKLNTDLEPVQEDVVVTTPARISPVSIKVLGVGDLLTRLANCCHPLPGDEIIGYITQGRGITVHQKSCLNIINEMEKERLIPVEWGNVEQVYPATIRVNAWDRVGLIRDISTIIAEAGVNLTSMNMIPHSGDNLTSLYFTLEVKNAAQLAQIISKSCSVWDVISVTRKGELNVNQEVS